MFEYVDDKEKVPKGEVALDLVDGVLAPDMNDMALFMFSVGSPKYSEESSIKRYKSRLLRLYKEGLLAPLIEAIKPKEKVYLITPSSESTEYSVHVESFIDYLLR